MKNPFITNLTRSAKKSKDTENIADMQLSLDAHRRLIKKLEDTLHEHGASIDEIKSGQQVPDEPNQKYETLRKQIKAHAGFMILFIVWCIIFLVLHAASPAGPYSTEFLMLTAPALLALCGQTIYLLTK